MGRREIVQTLRTPDLKVARQRRHAALAEIQATIDAAANGSTQGPLAGIMRTAEVLRDELAAGRVDRHEAEAALGAPVDRYLDDAERRYGVDADGNANVPAADVESIKLAHSVLAGETVTLLSDAVKRYLRETSKHVTAGTLNAKGRQIAAFQSWLSRDVDVKSITRLIAGRYVSDELLQRGAAVKTTRGEVSSLSALWTFLEGRGEVSSNVWFKLSATVKDSTRGTAAKRRPWSSDELKSLLDRLDAGDVLVPLTVLAMWTGCRLEEICAMRVENVSKDSWRVVEGKTRAAVRTVPLATTIRPLVARLVESTTDDFLLPGLLSGGTDAKRSHLVGKRFGARIRALGYADTALCFHSLRNSFMQRLEEAGVPESTAKLLVGHQRQSLTFGGYSPGVSQKLLHDAVEKVTYGKTVDALTGRIAKTFTLETQSRRRPRRAA
jgi:integrase